jgi:hypothetical protein
MGRWFKIDGFAGGWEFLGIARCMSIIYLHEVAGIECGRVCQWAR